MAFLEHEGVIMLLLLLFGEKQCANAPSNLLYKAEVGERMDLKCPIEPAGCTHDGDGPLYNWEKYSDYSGESSNVPAGVHRILTIEVAGPEDGGMYRCHSVCQGEEFSAWVQLHVLPQLEVPHSGVGVHPGESFHLLCKGRGFPRPTVLWSATKDVGARDELNRLPQEEVVLDEYTVSRHLRVSSANPHMSGTYQCSVHHFKGLEDDSDSFHKTYYVPVIVYDPPELNPGDDVHVQLGQPAVLQCHVTPTDSRLRFNIEWFHIKGAVSTPCNKPPKYRLSLTPPTYSLGIDEVREEDVGLYECRVTSVYSQSEASGSVELMLLKRENSESRYLVLAVTFIIGAFIAFLCYGVMQKQSHSSQGHTTGGTLHGAEREEGTEQLQSPNTSQTSSNTSQTSSPAPARDRIPATVIAMQTETLTLEAYANKHRFQITQPQSP